MPGVRVKCGHPGAPCAARPTGTAARVLSSTSDWRRSPGSSRPSARARRRTAGCAMSTCPCHPRARSGAIAGPVGRPERNVRQGHVGECGARPASALDLRSGVRSAAARTVRMIGPMSFRMRRAAVSAALVALLAGSLAAQQPPQIGIAPVTSATGPTRSTPPSSTGSGRGRGPGTGASVQPGVPARTATRW